MAAGALFSFRLPVPCEQSDSLKKPSIYFRVFVLPLTLFSPAVMQSHWLEMSPALFHQLSELLRPKVLGLFPQHVTVTRWHCSVFGFATVSSLFIRHLSISCLPSLLVESGRL
ncbi:hypothetical protein L596_003190 [Steinernema carpocapsae]|uniref:Uncharacterized protein n=1 Tax=Steinernema carpocapsae TaxID=34508 RepID=A0A4U8UVR9_STECR|nr:hypothetical protein L596_003190 [Steinernema carpocapsae]